MRDHFEDSEYRFWWFAYIVVFGGVALAWHLFTRNLLDGREALAAWHIFALLASAVLGGIASLVGRFARNRRWQFRLFNAVLLFCFSFSAFWLYYTEFFQGR